MTQARNIVGAAGHQTLRLVADLGAPLLVRTRRLGASLRAALARTPRVSIHRRHLVATVAVVALIGAAALAILHGNGPAAGPGAEGQSQTAQAPLGPVKIVDATPRSASCDQQVWPYIEPHCLRRAPADSAASPPTRAAATAPPEAAVQAAVPEPSGAAPRAEIVGAAPRAEIVGAAPRAEIAAAAPPPDTAVAAAVPTATAAPSGMVDSNGVPLTRRVGPESIDGSTAALAGGAAGAGLAAWQLARPEPAAEPRRRSARRAFRGSRRAGFPLFGLRF